MQSSLTNTKQILPLYEYYCKILVEFYEERIIVDGFTLAYFH